MDEETRAEAAERNARRVARLERDLRLGKMLRRSVSTADRDGREVTMLVLIRPIRDGRFTIEVETYVSNLDIGELREETFTLDTLEEAKECLTAETGIPFTLLSLQDDYNGPRGGPNADALLADALAAMRSEAPEAVRGFGPQRGTCGLCGEPLGLKRDVMRGPVLDFHVPAQDVTAEMAKQMSRCEHQAMHQGCWRRWAYADPLARAVVKQTARSPQWGETLAQGEFTGAWRSGRRDPAPSYGVLLFARSSKISLAPAPYADVCEIRDWTAHLAALIDMVGAGRLVPGFDQIVPAQGGAPGLEVRCSDVEQDRLEVQLISGRDGSQSETCFLRLDDLQDMRGSLSR